MWAEREGMFDDPFAHAMNLIRNTNIPTARLINNLIEIDVDDVGQSINNLYQKVLSSQSSKCMYYKEINPNLIVHGIYSGKNSTVNELERMSWSKLRLSAHSLAIETGRWNRRGRGRLPIEERLCQCGCVQTERHVFENCIHSQHFRNLYNISSLPDLVSERQDFPQVCHIVHKILDIYK